MIAFGICVGSDDALHRWARPGIARAVGPGAIVFERRGATSIFEAYNSILDEASLAQELEGLVLLHDDPEIRDERLVPKLRAFFADPSVGLVGAIGARGVSSLAWWEGDRQGWVSHDGPDGPVIQDFGTDTAEVDSVDGLFMALPRWTVLNLRFDARTYPGFHGYDADYCFEVRASGRRVVVGHFDVHHHNASRTFVDRYTFLANNLRWRAKWGFDSSRMLWPRRVALRVRSVRSSVAARLARIRPS